MANVPSLTDLLARWHDSQRQGQTLSLDELWADCPERLAELRQHVEAVAAMQALVDGANRQSAAESLSSEAPTLAPRPPADSWETRTAGPSSAAAGKGGQDTRALPQVPGYEILGELGRGGMGVVYKARQTALKRVVALKMILAGAHAGAGEVQRFRAEAEAVARLQHPGIVQVYEVGEHEGLPFFSLEFCPGGSLDRKLAGTPLKPKDAAQLVETLARAMHAAHEKNVLHRDLKSANVLLSESGQPKITDFGLAKKLDEAGQTASGAIMGTPSYMAPEQAGGKSGQLGPAADIYALGAILYEALTGRPPFKAATALDTVMQVVADEPVPVLLYDSQIAEAHTHLQNNDLIRCRLALSGDGKRLASGSEEGLGESGEIKVWDLEAGKQVRTLRGHTRPVTSLAHSGDGKRLLSGSSDKTIKLWNVSPDQEPHTRK